MIFKQIRQFFTVVFQALNSFRKSIQKIGNKNKKIFTKFQLTTIYFLAIVVLLHTVKNNLRSMPEIFFVFIPYLDQILKIKIFQFFATPEKNFLLYMVILEIIISRPVFKFSPLIKFNVLLIFILEMCSNLIVAIWDLVFFREIDVAFGLVQSNQNLNQYFFIVYTFFMLCVYLYSYIQSVRGKYPNFPEPISFITDSVAFWMRIDTQRRKDGRKFRKPKNKN